MAIKIDSRLQEAAVVLADELHFGRASQRLHIATSTLSKQIAQLEEKLDTTLFLRDSKGVELTEPGKAYVEHIRTALLEAERAILLAKAAKEGLHHVLVVGHSPSTDPAFVSFLLAVHLPLYPNLKIRLQSDFMLNLIHGLLASELDLAILASPPEELKLTLVHLVTSTLYVLLPEDHNAALQNEVTLSDLAVDAWILFNKRTHPLLYDAILMRAEALGIQPKTAHHFVTPQEALHLVAEGEGIALLAKPEMQIYRHPGVTVRPLGDEVLRVTTYLALRADEHSRMVNEFARAFLRKCCEPDSGTQMKLPIGL